MLPYLEKSLAARGDDEMRGHITIDTVISFFSEGR